MTSLLLVSIGPVQDFIAAARRGRDLWFGSWFLSEISKAAARAIVEAEDARQPKPTKGWESLIFPALSSHDLLEPGSSFNCVNKLLARVETPPDTLMQQVKTRVHERLMTLWEGVTQRIHLRANEQTKPPPPRALMTEVALRQLHDLLELTWAALPLPTGSHDAYPRVRADLEALLSARKSLRDFSPVTWGAEVPKSALDGLRESVLHEDVYKSRPGESPAQREWRLYRGFGVSPGERLCAIGLLKRLGRPQNWSQDDDEQDRSPSASHMAAIPLLTRIKAHPHHQARVDGHLKTLLELGERGGRLKRELKGDLYYPPGETKNPLPCQGRVLYASRLSELLGTDELAKEGARHLKALLDELTEGREPSPYYALLLADGDRMGDAVDRQRSIDAHRGLSKALSGFAEGVRQQLDGAFNGRLIYAGGDDILAYLPLHTLLRAIHHLSNAFRTQMASYATTDNAPTLSFGVVIAHHMEPLSDVLERVRQAERTAKAHPGKDALALTLSKRGGADVTVCDQTLRLVQRLSLFSYWHSRELFPDGAAYELRDAALRHAEPLTSVIERPEPSSLLRRKALAYDALRILSRKQAERGSRKLDESVRVTLEALLLNPEDVPPHEQGRLHSLLEPWTQPIPLRDDKTLRVRALADELIVARILADSADQAGQTLCSPLDAEAAQAASTASHPLQEARV